MTEHFCTLTWPTAQIAQITLNRPEKLNAINVEMLQQWRSHIDLLLQKKTKPRCLILTGTGRAFSSGADIRATIEVARAHNGDLGSILSAYYNPLITLIRSLPFPIISVVNGLAVGVGFSFALHGDVILAADQAYFWANFSEIGLAPDGAMSYLLPRTMGYHRAIAHTLLAKKLTAAEAKDLGIVYQTFPQKDLMHHALALAEQICSSSPVATQETVRLFREGLERSFHDQLQAESASQARAGFSPEAKEAITRFLSRRNRPKD